MSQPAKYRKKPVVIEAMQVDGFLEIAKWMESHGLTWIEENTPGLHESGFYLHSDDSGTYLFIRTLEGDMEAKPGDYIIRGVQGEFYPCKPGIFEETYEPAPAPAAEPAVGEGDTDLAKQAIEALSHQLPLFVQTLNRAIEVESAWNQLRLVVGHDTRMIHALTNVVASGTWSPAELDMLTRVKPYKPRRGLRAALVRVMQRITRAADRKTLQLRSNQGDR
ncbi:hypothetical protein [Nesterenkonia rhizosphaerae]|uniref:Cyclic nucleotide-binding domain-containing protein n=1 Tax=Nesterenkonia rhizosphaerae TaxID=1348272 RepID=A0ABP9FZZ2_9MICC